MSQESTKIHNHGSLQISQIDSFSFTHKKNLAQISLTEIRQPADYPLLTSHTRNIPKHVQRNGVGGSADVKKGDCPRPKVLTTPPLVLVPTLTKVWTKRSAFKIFPSYFHLISEVLTLLKKTSYYDVSIGCFWGGGVGLQILGKGYLQRKRGEFCSHEFFSYLGTINQGLKTKTEPQFYPKPLTPNRIQVTPSHSLFAHLLQSQTRSLQIWCFQSTPTIMWLYFPLGTMISPKVTMLIFVLSKDQSQAVDMLCTQGDRRPVVTGHGTRQLG